MGLIDAITAIPGDRCLDDCDEWCVGLPFERIRTLDSDEIGTLQFAVNSQGRQQRALAVSNATVFALFYVSTMVFPNPVLFWLTATDGAFLTLFILWLAFARRSWIRKNRAMHADIAMGTVHCFHHPFCAGPLEVLPRAETVYKSNEFSPKEWHRAAIMSTAKTPVIALIASEWLQPVEGSSGQVLAGKRKLSGSEIAEIGRWVETKARSVKISLTFFLVWISVVAFLWRDGASITLLAAALVLALSTLRFVPDLQQLYSLKRDIVGGMVIINRRTSKQNGSYVPLGRSAEYLPQSKAKWTDGGLPAEWRKFA